MHSSNSGLAHGTSGSPQQTMEQEQYGNTVSSIEEAARQQHETYLRQELPKTSPLHVPGSAAIKEEHKVGYEQVKYTWNRGDYKYLSRWHTRTPNAPAEQGPTWVVERRIPGVGYGKNYRPPTHEVLVKTQNGSKKWVSWSKWRDAINARKRGTITQEQEELLNNGHWKAR